MVQLLSLRVAIVRAAFAPSNQTAIASRCLFSTTSLKRKDDILLSSHKNNVTTLTMNQPKKLNGWTMEMMKKIKDSMDSLAKDPATKVVVLTGADPYYCAGNKGAKVNVFLPYI
jgi:1,4-dihydroxy-2-naphthoyl-CoA synthase